MLTLLKANLKEAAASLLATRQRSLLALLGIAIGIGSVIAMISVGMIVRDEALKHFRELGTDILNINLRQSEGRLTVTPEVAQGLTSLPTIAAAAPFVASYGEVTFAGRTIKDVTFIGATAALANLNKLKIKEGRHISDLDRRRYFCVIGAGVAEDMRRIGFEHIIGETVKAGSGAYTVVGVLQYTPQGRRRFDVNQSIIIPVSTAQRVFRNPGISNITARMSQGIHHVVATREVVKYFQRKARDLNVRVRSAEELIEQMHKQMRLFALMLGSVGGISLLVGGIGIMNVMLVSVSERRQEIGIRRALGARRVDIQTQFLIESLMLSLAGGMVGVGAGIGTTWAICQFTDWTFMISVGAMVLGVSVASAAGVFFGFYPAWQAARLDPIAALRGT